MGHLRHGIAAAALALTAAAPAAAEPPTVTVRMARHANAASGLVLHVSTGHTKLGALRQAQEVTVLPPDGTRVELPRTGETIGTWSGTLNQDPAALEVFGSEYGGDVFGSRGGLVLPYLPTPGAAVQTHLGGGWHGGGWVFADSRQKDQYGGFSRLDLRMPARDIGGAALITTPRECPRKGWRVRVLVFDYRGSAWRLGRRLPCTDALAVPDGPLPTIDATVVELAKSLIWPFDHFHPAPEDGTAANGRVDPNEWKVSRGPRPRRGSVLDGTPVFKEMDGDGGPKDKTITRREAGRWIQRCERADGNADGVLSPDESDHIEAIFRVLVDPGLQERIDVVSCASGGR